MSDLAHEPLITVKDLTQEFNNGDQVIRPLTDVNFTIAKNSFNIIYGASGSGKSTLLNILTGLQKPTHGSVTIDGQDIYKLDRDGLANFRADQIGFIYQDNYWVKSLNVLDNVSMSLYFSGLSRKQASQYALSALSSVQMEGYAKKYPIYLSGGEQQRVATARALATNPAFLIADEPTGSLDSRNGDIIMNLLQDCKTNLGATIILVTHNMEYLPFADKLIHIADGRVEETEHESMKKITEELFTSMKDRISHFMETKKA